MVFFTPAAWETRVWNQKVGWDDNSRKADPLMKSSMFTLKNPRKLSASTYGLKASAWDRAVLCIATLGFIR
jgi:hypothetical protein